MHLSAMPTGPRRSWIRCRSSWVATASTLVLVATSSAAHVFPPSGTPTGHASQGSRVASVTNDGSSIKLTGDVGTTGDTSIHFLWCFDEGLGSEQPYSSAGGNVPSGKTSSSGSNKIPSGSQKVHYVIYFDKNGDNTWAQDGWVNL